MYRLIFQLPNWEDERTRNRKSVYHTIRKGETLGHIATRYKTTITKLCQLNGISRMHNQRRSPLRIIVFNFQHDYSLLISFYCFSNISLYGGVLLMIFAVIAWHGLQKYKIGLILLVISAIILRFSFIQFDSFLHIWDERFHALVARNLIDNPLKPTLYQNPLLPYNPDIWITNHIWLHKPPLFLWQIALSIKLFGINEFAIRFPSALMSILMLFFLWQIGKIALNKHIAFYALLLYIPSSYFLELTTGFFPTDHNDIAFIFYVTASIWGWVRYNQNKCVCDINKIFLDLLF